MVLIATPLHDIARPVVFIENNLAASLPDFLGEAIAEIAEHYARTTLPEFSLYKYADITTNLVDEAKALTPLEDAAHSSIISSADPLRMLTELPGPGKALIHHLKDTLNSRKPCDLEKRVPVFQTLLPTRRPHLLLQAADKNPIGPLLSEPVLAFSESSLHNAKKGDLVDNLVSALDIQTEPATSPFSFNDAEEKSTVLAKLTFQPQSQALSSEILKSVPSSAFEILHNSCCFYPPRKHQDARYHLSCSKAFLTESIRMEKTDIDELELLHGTCKEPPAPSLLNALSQRVLELHIQQKEKGEDGAANKAPIKLSSVTLLRTIGLPDNGSSDLQGASKWKPRKYQNENKLTTATATAPAAVAASTQRKRKLPEALLLFPEDATSMPLSFNLDPSQKKKKKILQQSIEEIAKDADDDGRNQMEEEPIIKNILKKLEVPLLPEHLQAAGISTDAASSLFPLAAFPELLKLPPGASDLALGLTNNQGILPTTTAALKNTTFNTAEGHVFTNNNRKRIKSIEECNLLWNLVAKEMAPDGENLLLSLSALPKASGITTALDALLGTPSLSNTNSGAASLDVVDVMRDCGVVKQNTGSVALMLDWSLSTHQASLRNPELLAACRNVKDSINLWLKKKKIKSNLSSNTILGTTAAAAAAVVLSSLVAPHGLQRNLDKSESSRKSLSLSMSPSSYHDSAMVASAAALGDGALAATPCNHFKLATAAGAPASAAAPGAGEEEDGVRPGKRPRILKEVASNTAVPAPGGLGFFMQLQRGGAAVKGGVAAPPVAAAGNNNVTASSTKLTARKKSTSSMSDSGLSDFLAPLTNTVQTTTVALPASHLALLCCLRNADAELFALIPPQFLPPGVTSQDFPEIENLSIALRNAKATFASTSSSVPASGGGKSVLRTLAGVVILRQTAKLIIHHGVRAANMYFSSSIQELPGIFITQNNISNGNMDGARLGGGGGSGGDVGQVLAEAAGKIESGQGEDHPKHTALRQTLVTINTLATGSKILVIGDSKSFFTLYSVVHAAGLRPCHLDREGQLLFKSGTSSGNLEREKEAIFSEAIFHACTVSDCILAATELVLHVLSTKNISDVLFSAFQHVIIYVSEPGMQEQVLQAVNLYLHPPAAGNLAAPSIQNSTPAWRVTVFAVHVGPFTILPPPPRGEHHQKPLNPNPIEHTLGPFDRQLNQISSNNNTKQLERSKAVEITLKAAVPAAPSLDYQLVLSNSMVRPVKSRRDLYENIITLENEGAVIVERSMQHLDIVLSPSATLIVLTEESVAAGAGGAASVLVKANNPGGGPDFDLCVQHISQICERISRAFSKLHLVCEGSAGFRAQLLCGHSRLVTAAARCNLTLQCDISSDAASTSALVRSIACAYLHEWTKRPSTLHYSIGDPPSAYEIFLAAVPSLNPHSAAALAGCGLTLQQLFSLDSFVLKIGEKKVPALLGLVPAHSMELFKECCAAGKPLGGGGGIGVGTGGFFHAAIEAPPPPPVSHYAPQPYINTKHHPKQINAVEGLVDDLPETLEEFITKPPTTSAAAAAAAAAVIVVPAVNGRGGGDCGEFTAFQGGGRGGGSGAPVFSAAAGGAVGGGNASADSMPAPSWCGPQLGGTTHHEQYVQHQYDYEYDHHHHHQQQQGYHPGQRQQQQQHRPISTYQSGGEEVDEFGVPLDPLASWEGAGAANRDLISHEEQQQWHHHHQLQHHHQQHGYGYGYGYGHSQYDEQEAVSNYAPPPVPPWIAGRMPLPGLAPTRQRQAPSLSMMPPPPLPPQRGGPSLYYNQQQQQPTHSVFMNDDDRISELSTYQYQEQQQQHQSYQQPQNRSFAAAAPGGGGGGARGYTAAALNKQQQQHSASMWQSISNTTGTGTAPLSSGGADYLKRKWGGGRGTRRGGGGGRGRGRKYSSRTQRQW